MKIKAAQNTKHLAQIESGITKEIYSIKCLQYKLKMSKIKWPNDATQ